MSYYRLVSGKLWNTDDLSSSAKTTVQVEGTVVKNVDRVGTTDEVLDVLLRKIGFAASAATSVRSSLLSFCL
jgi:hypothetical protein